MLNFSKYFFFIVSLLFISSCQKAIEPTSSGYKGKIYYTKANEINVIDLATNTNTPLFSNARHFELTKSGAAIVVEQNPIYRLIYTDLTGANRKTILEWGTLSGPQYRQYFTKPRISYDQKYIAYFVNESGNYSVYVIDAQSGALIATIGNYQSSKPNGNPSWSPDGTLFVDGSSTMNNGIFQVSNDFTTLTRIDPNLSNVSSPSVSPDGTKIAFIRDQKVWMMNSDGTNPIQLYTGSEKFNSPTWSPESKFIAAIGSNEHIYIIDPTTLTLKEINLYHIVETSEQLCWVY